MFPLEVAMLPGEELPLQIFEPRYTQLVRDCLAADDPVFGVVLIAAGREVGGGDRRCDVGARARIVDCADAGGGRYRLKCLVAERIRVTSWLPDEPYPRADVRQWPDEPGAEPDGRRFGELEDRIVALFARLTTARGIELPDRDTLLGPAGTDSAERLYMLASRVPIGQADRYAVLAAPTVAARLAALSEAVDTVAALVEFQNGG